MPQAPLKPAAVEPGRYRHFKGDEYEVFSVGRHTDEFVVVYASVEEPQMIWVRPLEMFVEEVEVEDARLPRFAYAPVATTYNRGPLDLPRVLAALLVRRLLGGRQPSEDHVSTSWR